MKGVKAFLLRLFCACWPWGAEKIKRRDAAVRIQNWWRSTILLVIKKEEKRKDQLKAAVTIQKWWRRAFSNAITKAAQTTAIIVLQRVYRGWKTRKEFSFVKDYLAALKYCENKRTYAFKEIFAGSSPCKLGEGKFAQVYSAKSEGVDWAFKVLPFSLFPCERKILSTDLASAFRDVQASLAINKLRREGLNSCQGFIYVEKVWMSRGNFKEFFRGVSTQSGDIDSEASECSDLVHCLIMQMENAGTALKSFEKSLSPTQTLSILSQVSCSLAVAEKVLEFEHRDLHGGNVLLKPTKELMLKYHVDGQVVTVPSCGLKVTIIDFSISRLKTEGKIIYKDLSVECQSLKFGEKVKNEGGGDYSLFFPISNRFFIFMLGDVLIRCLKANKKAFRNKLFVYCQKAQQSSSLTAYYKEVLLPPLRKQQFFDRWLKLL